MVHFAHHFASDAYQEHVHPLPKNPQQARFHGKLKRSGSVFYIELLRFIALLID